MVVVTLVYETEIHVTVDTEDEIVTKVVIDDEGATQKWAEPDAVPITASEGDSLEDALKAIEIADQAMWPVWEHGF
jgi:hypothetical protein